MEPPVVCTAPERVSLNDVLILHGFPTFDFTLLIAKFVDVYGCTLYPVSSTKGCDDAL